MSELTRTVVVEVFSKEGTLQYTERQKYKTAFNFDRDKALAISRSHPMTEGTLVIKSGDKDLIRGFLFVKPPKVNYE